MTIFADSRFCSYSITIATP